MRTEFQAFFGISCNDCIPKKYWIAYWSHCNATQLWHDVIILHSKQDEETSYIHSNKWSASVKWGWISCHHFVLCFKCDETKRGDHFMTLNFLYTHFLLFQPFSSFSLPSHQRCNAIMSGGCGSVKHQKLFQNVFRSNQSATAIRTKLPIFSPLVSDYQKMNWLLKLKLFFVSVLHSWTPVMMTGSNLVTKCGLIKKRVKSRNIWSIKLRSWYLIPFPEQKRGESCSRSD